MHAFVLIPLLTAIGAAALASAILAREPDLRANRLVALILLCDAFWAACEFFWNTSADPAVATRFTRWSSLGTLSIAPLGFQLFLAVQPQLAPRFRGLLRLSYAITGLCILSSVATDWYTRGVVRTDWGWAPVAGPSLPFVYAAVLAGPLLAVADWLRSGGHRANRPLRHLRWLELAPGVPLGVASLTDFALPLYGIHVPRLGAASILAWGGIVFWTVYRFRTPVIAPRRFAREILETLPDGIVLLHLDGRIRATNGRMCELVDRPSDELMGRPLDDWLVEAGEVSGPARVHRESELRVGSGGRIPVAVSRTTLRDEAGDVVGFVVSIRDLSEIASLRSRLITAGRLAAVGQLAAGIAHEINNPVAYVRTNAGVLERQWDEVEEALAKHASPAARLALDDGRELLRECHEGIERLTSIVRDVGGFSRSGPAERELGDVNELLETAVRVAAPQLRGRAAIERDYGEVPLIRCVRQELMQVFLNLLLNAGQSLDGEGTIRLTTRVEGDALRVSVEDDGPGIAPAARARIFEPFFTTKPAGEGTGLGLSISRQIVEKHRGRIRAESGPGRGAHLVVELPLGRADAPRDAATETRCTPTC